MTYTRPRFSHHEPCTHACSMMPSVDETANAGRPTSGDPARRETSALAWVGPFAVFMLWLAVDKYLPIANPGKELLRDAVLLAAIVGFSWRVLPNRAPYWLASIALGVAVFALWILPDTLIPVWRSHSIFQNSITGRLKTSIPPTELTPLMLAL